MIKLENVVIKYYFDDKTKRMLEENNVFNCEELKDYISNNLWLEKPVLGRYLSYVEDSVNRYNIK